MSPRRLTLITLGVLLSMFLSSMEGTVVATAMPTIVGQLGGLSIYSWVFSIYMLASTTTVPIYGKLSDLYGRKRVYAISMSLFLVGSVLCSQAATMEQLVLFRAVQGLGAGGVLPLAFTIIGEIFSFEQRTRMQGLFSGVWGVSAVVGPLVGGFLVDQASWQWVFLINLFPGLLALALVWLAWRDAPRASKAPVRVDYPGAILLALATLALLLGLDQLEGPLGLALLVAAGALFAAWLWAERRAADPILPLHLFRDRLFAVGILRSVFSSWAVFGSLNFVPLFVQAVLGTSATQAGITLTPMSLSWTIASIIGSQLLLRLDYRSMAVAGMVVLAGGVGLMTTIGLQTSPYLIMVYTGMMGVGMGLSTPAFLIAVQSSVRRRDLGAATSTLQFSGNIGGTLGVSVMGAFLTSRLADLLSAAGLDPAVVSLDSLTSSDAGVSQAVNGLLREALAVATANMFFIALAAGLLGLAAVFFAPRGKIAQLERDRLASHPSD